MNTIERVVTALCCVTLWLSTSVIFVILVANTVLRYATGASLQWANEVPELLFPWLVMSGVVLAAASGAHITTTFLVEVLPPAARRSGPAPRAAGPRPAPWRGRPTQRRNRLRPHPMHRTGGARSPPSHPRKGEPTEPASPHRPAQSRR